jgi:hypothetical protein
VTLKDKPDLKKDIEKSVQDHYYSDNESVASSVLPQSTVPVPRLKKMTEMCV